MGVFALKGTRLWGERYPFMGKKVPVYGGFENTAYVIDIEPFFSERYPFMGE